MALCSTRRDLYPGCLLWRPFSDIVELCVLPSFCGLHDRSVSHIGPAPRCTRRSQNKTDCCLDRDSGECAPVILFSSDSHPYQCGFALRYINIFFCPAFVTLPLSPSISGVEVAKIIAVFSQCSPHHFVHLPLTFCSHWICRSLCFYSIHGSGTSARSGHIQARDDRAS